MPWRLINQERHNFLQNIHARLFPTPKGCPKLMSDPDPKDPDVEIFYFHETEKDRKLTDDELKTSPFVQFGLKDISFAIEDVNFRDPEMKKAISAPETARLNAKSIKLMAEAEGYKKRVEGAGAADARKAMIDVIKDHPDLEFLYDLREMAQGSSNTILYQIPGAFENRINSILGDNTKIGDLLKMLSAEDRKTIEVLILESIEGLKKKGGDK
jgi:hypothetical protein